MDALEGVKIVGCKWVFKRKTDMKSNVYTYKARLIVKGFIKRHGIDYEKTFLSIAMFNSIRIILVIDAHQYCKNFQLDVKTIFLNGNFVEDVYMVQPDGFILIRHVGKVCKL